MIKRHEHKKAYLYNEYYKINHIKSSAPFIFPSVQEINLWSTNELGSKVTLGLKGRWGPGEAQGLKFAHTF